MISPEQDYCGTLRKCLGLEGSEDPFLVASSIWYYLSLNQSLIPPPLAFITNNWPAILISEVLA